MLVWAGVDLLFFILAALVLWICAENSLDNTGMFLFLLSSAYTE